MTKLTNIEKLAIQKLVEDGESAASISKVINKPETTINTYLTNLVNSITRLKKNGVEVQNLEVTKDAPAEQVVIDVPLKEVLQVDEKTLVTKEMEAKIKQNRFIAKQGIINKSAGGREGIAIMTPVASQIGDAFQEVQPTTRSRSARGNLFDIKKGEIIKD